MQYCKGKIRGSKRLNDIEEISEKILTYTEPIHVDEVNKDNHNCDIYGG